VEKILTIFYFTGDECAICMLWKLWEVMLKNILEHFMYKHHEPQILKGNVIIVDNLFLKMYN